MQIETLTVQKIYAAWKERGDSEAKRTYLGASVIGHPCDRYLWLYFHAAVRESIEGRTYRLFNRGNLEEERFVSDLKSIGCQVWPTDPNTGRQFEVSALGGHFGGHLDAVALGVPEAPKTPHVCEFKTHNDASFKALQKNGVLAVKPMHYAQMQVYMHLMGLTRALYLAVNKNDDALYSERMHYDKAYATSMIDRARDIIALYEANDVPRCAEREDDFRCKMCAYRSLCWGKCETVVDKCVCLGCRNCCHATALTDVEGRKWTCNKGHDCDASRPPCADHVLYPILVNAELDTTCADGIIYKTKDGATFKNGVGGYSSDDLQGVSREDTTRAPVVRRAANCGNCGKTDCKVNGESRFNPCLQWFPKKGCSVKWNDYIKC